MAWLGGLAQPAGVHWRAAASLMSHGLLCALAGICQMGVQLPVAAGAYFPTGQAMQPELSTVPVPLVVW